MEYLQYISTLKYLTKCITVVLNLVINGIPSILALTHSRGIDEILVF